MASSGVAGQVVIEVVAKDKINLGNLNNKFNQSGLNDGRAYSDAFSQSLGRIRSDFLTNLKGIISDSVYTFRDPFIGLRSMAARAGSLCAEEFLRGFSLVSKKSGLFSTDVNNINQNMKNRLPIGNYAKNQRWFNNTPYYLMDRQQQAFARLNPYNFSSNWGTGNGAVNFWGMRNFGRAERQIFRNQMSLGNWTNTGLGLTAAMRNNYKAFGNEYSPFAYYGGKGSKMLSQRLNQLLVRPNLPGMYADKLLSSMAKNPIPTMSGNGFWSKNVNALSGGVNKLVQGAANVLPGAIGAGVNLAGASMPVMIQGASTTFLLALSQSLVGIFGAGFIAKNALQEYGQFQQSAMRFEVLQPGITKDDVKAVTGKAKSTARSLPLITGKELMYAVEAGQRGGVLNNYAFDKNIQPMLDFIDFIGQGASAFKNQGISAEKLANDIISLGSVFDIKDPSKYKDMTNKLLYGTTLSRSDINDMIDYLILQGTQNRARGLTFEEGIAEYIAQVNELGMTGHLLAGQNRSMERGMDSKQALFNQLGVATVDKRGAARSKLEIAKDLNDALLKYNPSLGMGQKAQFAAAFFNSHGSRGGVMTHPEKYYDALNLITNTPADLIDRYADVATKGVVGITGRISSIWNAINLDIGEQLDSEFQRVGELFIKALDKFGLKLQDKFGWWVKYLEGLDEEEISGIFDDVSSLFMQIFESGQKMAPTLTELIKTLPSVAEAFTALNNAVAGFMNDPIVKRLVRGIDDKWDAAYQQADARIAAGEKKDRDKLAEEIYHGKAAPAKSDWRTEENITKNFGQDQNAGWFKRKFNKAREKIVTANLYNPLNYLPVVGPAATVTGSFDNLWANMGGGYANPFAENLDNQMQKSNELDKQMEKHREKFRQLEADRKQKEIDEKSKASGYIVEPLKEAPAGFDQFADRPGTKRQLEAYFKNYEPIENRLPARKYQDFISGKYKNFDDPSLLPDLIPHNTWGQDELTFARLDSLKGTLFEDPSMFWTPMADWYIKQKNRVEKGYYDEKEYGDFLRSELHGKGFDFDREYFTEDIMARDMAEVLKQPKGENKAPVLKQLGWKAAEELAGIYAQGLASLDPYEIQDIADDYGVDSLQFRMYERGKKRRERIEFEEEQNGKKRVKTKQKEDRNALEQKKIERAERKAEREYNRELQKRMEDMEKWKIQAANDFDFKVAQAQEFHNQQVSGALGSLKGVIGSNWGYISNKEVQDAMVYYDPTQPMKMSDILEMQQKYGTADPRKAAQMQSIMNMQDMANAKAFQEQMWYEYIDAVCQGGTTNEINIEDAAIVFNIPKLESITIKDSDISLMAQKVDAFLGDEVKDDIKAIREYCDEQNVPISI